MARCLSTETLAAYAHELAEWVLGEESVLAPLVFATASTDALAAIQQQYGAQKASQAVETLFSQLAARLAAEGVTRFIVAGGGDLRRSHTEHGHKRVSYWPNHFPRRAVGKRTG